MIWKICRNQNNGWIMCLELVSFYCVCRMVVTEAISECKEQCLPTGTVAVSEAYV